jgi:adenosylcobinamide-GDP ribazoletransferase
VTGGFHHDGLADVADAYGGGWDVEQRLAILKDSRHGTYGVLALVLALVVQVQALATHDPRQAFAVLVAAHSTARAGAVVLLRVAPRARGTGLGTEYARGLPAGAVILAVLGTVALDVVLLGALAAWVLAAAAVAAGAVAWLAVRKVGGVNGDALGAAEQVAETLVLLCGAALVTQAGTWPWWR